MLSDDFLQIMKIAKVCLTTSELDGLSVDLSHLVKEFDASDAVWERAEPFCYRGFPMHVRDDVVKTINRSDILNLAPTIMDNHFAVPKVINYNPNESDDKRKNE